MADNYLERHQLEYEKKKAEFDISDGLEGILSYDPYASFQKGGDVNAE